MALQRFDEDIAYISKLGDDPYSDNGLTVEGFKKEFDRGPLSIQKYINDVLVKGIEDAGASSVVASNEKPASFPALWLDTSDPERPRIVYINKYGQEIVPAEERAKGPPHENLVRHPGNSTLEAAVVAFGLSVRLDAEEKAAAETVLTNSARLHLAEPTPAAVAAVQVRAGPAAAAAAASS